MARAIAGSEVAITVESMFSMNNATATMSGTMRSSFSFGSMCSVIGLLLALGRTGLQALQALRRLLEAWVELERLAEIGGGASGIAKALADQAARGERNRRPVVERNGSVGVAERIGVIAGKVMGPGAVVVGEREIRRE